MLFQPACEGALVIAMSISESNHGDVPSFHAMPSSILEAISLNLDRKSANRLAITSKQLNRIVMGYRNRTHSVEWPVFSKLLLEQFPQVNIGQPKRMYHIVLSLDRRKLAVVVDRNSDIGLCPHLILFDVDHGPVTEYPVNPKFEPVFYNNLLFAGHAHQGLLSSADAEDSLGVTVCNTTLHPFVSVPILPFVRVAGVTPISGNHVLIHFKASMEDSMYVHRGFDVTPNGLNGVSSTGIFTTCPIFATLHDPAHSFLFRCWTNQTKRILIEHVSVVTIPEYVTDVNLADMHSLTIVHLNEDNWLHNPVSYHVNLWFSSVPPSIKIAVDGLRLYVTGHTYLLDGDQTLDAISFCEVNFTNIVNQSPVKSHIEIPLLFNGSYFSPKIWYADKDCVIIDSLEDGGFSDKVPVYLKRNPIAPLYLFPVCSGWNPTTFNLVANHNHIESFEMDDHFAESLTHNQLEEVFTMF